MKVRLLVLGLLVIGVVISVSDWRKWKQEETKRYGWGWVAERESKAAVKLVNKVRNDIVGVSVGVPEYWEVENNGNKIRILHPFTLGYEGLRTEVVLELGESTVPSRGEGWQMEVKEKMVGDKKVVMTVLLDKQMQDVYKATFDAIYSSIK